MTGGGVVKVNLKALSESSRISFEHVYPDYGKQLDFTVNYVDYSVQLGLGDIFVCRDAHAQQMVVWFAIGYKPIQIDPAFDSYGTYSEILNECLDTYTSIGKAGGYCMVKPIGQTYGYGIQHSKIENGTAMTDVIYGTTIVPYWTKS